MKSRARTAFEVLIAVQAAHSVEEFIFQLFGVFVPARFVSSLLSSDLARGFAYANAAIVLFGVWCYIARIRVDHPSARTYAWFWTCLEFANGAGHIILAATRGGYFPGILTAPFLIGASLYLAAGLKRGE